MKEFLKECADKASIFLTDEQLQKFELFYEILLETNRSLNLTAITEMHEVVWKHFIDSLSVTNYVDLSGKKIIDVGTGAGFPGIPLAIFLPETEFVLMDSLQKRLRFIDEAVKECEIKNVRTVHGRAEEIGQDQMYREQFDCCVSRAVASLPVLLELCIPMVKVGGQFISYKSGLLEEELNRSKNAMKVLECHLEQHYEYTIPGTDFYRVFAVFQKDHKLKAKYPRQAGKPKKSPL